ncbi:MAG: transglutaminase-like domain-containing protein, partial [Nanoarchaeota archaeon]|nr:transglutaminase-like domain-containing protein [Nanoarchaeota archaeon]
TLSNKTYHISTVQDFKEFVDPTNPVIKRTANLIATKTCSGERVCQAKAMYYFVRDNIEYVPDPVNFEYVEPAVEVLFSKGADCESGTFLLASLLESIGVDTELVFVPKHAFLRAKIPDALKSYKIEGWVYLDWTCKNCEFGEIPLGNSFEKRTFLDVGR